MRILLIVIALVIILGILATVLDFIGDHIKEIILLAVLVLGFLFTKTMVIPILLLTAGILYAPNLVKWFSGRSAEEQGTTESKAREDRDEQIKSLEKRDIPQEAKDILMALIGFTEAIKKFDDEIEDEYMSTKLKELEEQTRKIYKEIDNNPEKAIKLKKHVDYYIPTLNKILSKYAEYNESPAASESVKKMNAEIEHAMDLIVEAYSKVLEDLQETDVIDVSSDVSVMMTMLKQDGLLEDGRLQN